MSEGSDPDPLLRRGIKRFFWLLFVVSSLLRALEAQEDETRYEEQERERKRRERKEWRRANPDARRVDAEEAVDHRVDALLDHPVRTLLVTAVVVAVGLLVAAIFVSPELVSTLTDGELGALGPAYALAIATRTGLIAVGLALLAYPFGWTLYLIRRDVRRGTKAY